MVLVTIQCGSCSCSKSQYNCYDTNYINTEKEEGQPLYELLNKNSVTIKEKWEQLGLKLGLSKELLCTLGKKYKTSERIFYAVIYAWIRRKGVDCSSPSTFNSVTIRALVHALQSAEVCEGTLADKLVEIKSKVFKYMLYT